jgi:hypothetical protein
LTIKQALATIKEQTKEEPTMFILNSKYNFTANVSENVYFAFSDIASTKGLPVTVYLQTITKLTAIVANSTQPMFKDKTKVWVNLGDYSIHMKLSDYEKVNAATLSYHKATLGEYLRPRVSYW